MTVALVATIGSPAASAATRKSRSPNPASLVTSKARALGTITDGTTPLPDADFQTKSGKWTGWEVQLTDAVLKLLHLRVKWVLVSGTAEIAGIKSGRWQLSSDDWAVTSKRKKIINYVTDVRSGTRFLVARTTKLNLKSPGDLCGLTVAALTASIEETFAQSQAKKCAQENKPKLAVQIYPSVADVALAIGSGRAQVAWTISTTADYVAKQEPGKLKVEGKPFSTVTCGILVSKQYPGLAKAMAAAINEMIKSGKYAELLRRWGNNTAGLKHSSFEK